MKKSHVFYVIIFLAGVFLLDYYLYKLTGVRVNALAILFAIFIALIIVLLFLGCVIEWLNRPRKRTLRTHADKINALVDIFRYSDFRPDDEKWLQFRQWYPEISQQEIGELKDYLFRVHTTSENLAAQYLADRSNAKEFRRALSAEFPELDSKSLRELYAFGLYVMK